MLNAEKNNEFYHHSTLSATFLRIHKKGKLALGGAKTFVILLLLLAVLFGR